MHDAKCNTALQNATQLLDEAPAWSQNKRHEVHKPLSKNGQPLLDEPLDEIVSWRILMIGQRPLENDVIVNEDDSIDPVQCLKILSAEGVAKAANAMASGDSVSLCWMVAESYFKECAYIAKRMRRATKFYRDDLTPSFRDVILGE